MLKHIFCLHKFINMSMFKKNCEIFNTFFILTKLKIYHFLLETSLKLGALFFYIITCTTNIEKCYSFNGYYTRKSLTLHKIALTH